MASRARIRDLQLGIRLASVCLLGIFSSVVAQDSIPVVISAAPEAQTTLPPGDVKGTYIYSYGDITPLAVRSKPNATLRSGVMVQFYCSMESHIALGFPHHSQAGWTGRRKTLAESGYSEPDVHAHDPPYNQAKYGQFREPEKTSDTHPVCELEATEVHQVPFRGTGAAMRLRGIQQIITTYDHDW
ncbi:hypothetical protein NCU05379 [Neurospora crassa OR74A]|uniref:Uncharacterized protein n=1 Tax=Neurospora crassa (strain ATCC 24698 / 74-OR23-1A / CBS 708.71 / DSM 1257 / FGSC 987) TaxID=367110 RepID=Q1K8I0_NEUCR|nr:hypothetical protein NCU05379 [Neurospora crassa OR74A]EAA33956.2 hypothetical protein NCU05379 [Neurospora crassa OR74A]|eukprot:XP_963192.2 hypothetical protein NCU05379 [Neurospora crassa OR74A]